MADEGDGSGDEAFREELSGWRHAFQLEFGSFAWSDEDAIDPTWEVDVLTHVVNKQRGVFVSDAVWRPIWDVCEWFGPVAVASEPSESPHDIAPAVPKAWADMPWLLEEFAFEEHGQQPDGDGQDKDIKEQIAKIMEEATSADVMDALYDRREALAAAAPAPLRDFVWVVRGGAWTAAHAGVPFDSIRGEARGAEAIRFCTLYSLSKSATFAIRQHTEALAQELALEWCAKRQCLFDLWDLAGRTADFRFSEEDLASYVERPAFSEALREAGPQTLARAEAIRHEKPRLAGA